MRLSGMKALSKKRRRSDFEGAISYSPAISHDEIEENIVLTLPAFQDRMVVLVAGLVMILGLVYIVNRMRERSEAKRKSGDNSISQV